jgi:hypothetical protein
MSSKATAIEDLAIQNTLSMTVDERLGLLANLIVDKIVEDQKKGQPLLKRILELQNG